MRPLAPFLVLLEQLIQQYSVVGAERSFFKVIREELEKRGVNVTWYEGLMVAEGNDPDSGYFSAHADRHGLICTGPNEFQYAAFVAGARSDLLDNAVSEKLMHKVSSRFDDETLIAYDPWSGKELGQGKVLSANISEQMNNLVFETLGLEELESGTPVAFAGHILQTQGYIQGQLDNVIGVAALIDLYEQGYQGRAFFTAQEEAGNSWRFLLNWFRRHDSSTDNLIIIDSSPYPDRQAADQLNITLRRRDNNAHFNHKLTDELAATCKKLGFSYHFKDQYIEDKNVARQKKGESPLRIGTTELGRIIEGTKNQPITIQGSTIQLPTTDYHTLQETASLEDLKAFLSLIRHTAGLSAPIP